MEANINILQACIGYQKSSGKHVLLNNFTADFYPSELVGVVGLNGVGKSTLLKTMAGLLPLLSGQIRINGITLEALGEENLAKKVAVVLTEKFGGFNLRVIDVVRAGLIPHTAAFHRPTAAEEQLIDNAINTCGLQKHRFTYVDELSDGYFQRSVIAKALVQQSDILLMDEPAAFLDYAGKHELYLLLKQMSESQQKSILISSHDLDLLLKYCHKLLLITENNTALVTVTEAKNNPLFREIAKGFL